jgi:hypothetical protein
LWYFKPPGGGFLEDRPEVGRPTELSLKTVDEIHKVVMLPLVEEVVLKQEVLGKQEHHGISPSEEEDTLILFLQTEQLAKKSLHKLSQDQSRAHP